MYLSPVNVVARRSPFVRNGGGDDRDSAAQDQQLRMFMSPQQEGSTRICPATRWHSSLTEKNVASSDDGNGGVPCLLVVEGACNVCAIVDAAVPLLRCSLRLPDPSSRPTFTVTSTAASSAHSANLPHKPLLLGADLDPKSKAMSILSIHHDHLVLCNQFGRELVSAAVRKDVRIVDHAILTDGTADETDVVVLTADDALTVVSVDKKTERIRTLRSQGTFALRMTMVSVSPNGRVILCPQQNGMVSLFDATTLQHIHVFTFGAPEDNYRRVYRVVWSHDSSLVALLVRSVVGSSAVVEVRHVTGALVRSVYAGDVQEIAFSCVEGRVLPLLAMLTRSMLFVSDLERGSKRTADRRCVKDIGGARQAIFSSTVDGATQVFSFRGDPARVFVHDICVEE